MSSGRGSRASVGSALACTLSALHSLLSEVWGREGCFPSLAPLLRCASHRPEVQSLLGSLNLCSSPRPRRSPQGPHMPSSSLLLATSTHQDGAGSLCPAVPCLVTSPSGPQRQEGKELPMAFLGAGRGSAMRELSSGLRWRPECPGEPATLSLSVRGLIGWRDKLRCQLSWQSSDSLLCKHDSP